MWSHKLCVPRDEVTIVVGETQETLQLSFGSRDIPISQLADGFWVGLDTICRYLQILNLGPHELTL